MVCAVIEKMYLLASLFAEFQYLILTAILIFLPIVITYSWSQKSQSKSNPIHAPISSSQSSEEYFKTLLSTKFSDSCSVNWPLATYTRLRVGGNAEIFFRPTNLDQLLELLKVKPKEMAVTPLGMGSNVLIRDGGVPGLVIQILGRGFGHFEVVNGLIATEKTKVVECGAGLSQLKFAKVCAKAGISGLEFFCGIPGTIGGALRMNAGAHGMEVKDCLISATVLDPNGSHMYELSGSDMKYSYRHCGLPEDWIFIAAKFKGDYLVKSREEIECTIDEMMAYREDAQPVNERTAGCTFANALGPSAWKLIADAGCQGKVVGGAQISPKHGNFLINLGSATAEELETLGESVQHEVEQKSGVKLNWEVKRIGSRLKPDQIQKPDEVGQQM